jgi:hypothetical protein
MVRQHFAQQLVPREKVSREGGRPCRILQQIVQTLQAAAGWESVRGEQNRNLE